LSNPFFSTVSAYEVNNEERGMKKSRIDWLKENNHKVLLLVLLVILAIVCVQQIISMKYPNIVLLKGEYEGLVFPDPKIPSIEPNPIKLKDGNFPYTPGKYIYCRNLECDFLIHQSRVKCPWCKTPVREIGPPPKENDRDGDGILDKAEIAIGLNPEDPKDAELDNDNDGYTNIEEYKKHSISDPEDHPSIIHKLTFLKVEKVFYPMTVATIETGKFDPDKPANLEKQSWDIYADTYIGRKRSTYYKLGDLDKITGYKLIDLGLENKRPYALFKKGKEEPVKIFPKARRKVLTTVFVFKNLLTDDTIKVKEGDIFNLNDKAGLPERFKLMEYIDKEKTVRIRLYSEDDLVKLYYGSGLVPQLKD
jgi:hypothetical protein